MTLMAVKLVMTIDLDHGKVSVIYARGSQTFFRAAPLRKIAVLATYLHHYTLRFLLILHQGIV